MYSCSPGNMLGYRFVWARRGVFWAYSTVFTAEGCQSSGQTAVSHVRCTFGSPANTATKRIVFHKPRLCHLSRSKRPPPPPGWHWLVAFSDQVASVSCFFHSTQSPTNKCVIDVTSESASIRAEHSSQLWSVKRGCPGTGTRHAVIENSVQHSPSTHANRRFHS